MTCADEMLGRVSEVARRPGGATSLVVNFLAPKPGGDALDEVRRGVLGRMVTVERARGDGSPPSDRVLGTVRRLTPAGSTCWKLEVNVAADQVPCDVAADRQVRVTFLPGAAR